MNAIKHFFSKLFNKQSDGLSELGCYVFIGCDTEGNSFLKCNVKRGFDSNMAELLFHINSGVLTDTMLESLRETLNNNKRSDKIVKETYSMLVNFMEENEEEEDNNEGNNRCCHHPPGPVVDPCNIFSREERDDE